jgi:hypothetical protein
MKVRELIEKLQQYEQEKNIWILYDGFGEEEPDFVLATEDDVETLEQIKVGDYVHFAG